MAASKRAKVKFPPALPRVDVTTALASAENRSRFFATIRELELSGVVELVMRFVRAERGTFLRESAAWPAWVRSIVERALRTAETLEQFVLEYRTASRGEATEAGRRELMAHALEVLQALMDELFAQDEIYRAGDHEVSAGLSGFAPELARFHASSGVAAATHLAWCVRRAVLGRVEDPLWPFVASARASRTMRKQVGRERPRSCADLAADDVAILRACAEGPSVAKEVADRTSLSVSHVTKRKQDLRTWGLLEDVRAFVLSTEGRAWLDDIPAVMKAMG